jgi:hypothetical protein
VIRREVAVAQHHRVAFPSAELHYLL